jgi:hypothetical protein
MKSEDQSTRRPRGLTAFGVFLFWGAAMATLAGVTLVWRGTMLDHIWSLNPRAYSQLGPLGYKAGILMLVVAGALAVAGVGGSTGVIGHGLWRLRSLARRSQVTSLTFTLDV